MESGVPSKQQSCPQQRVSSEVTDPCSDATKAGGSPSAPLPARGKGTPGLSQGQAVKRKISEALNEPTPAQGFVWCPASLCPAPSGAWKAWVQRERLDGKQSNPRPARLQPPCDGVTLARCQVPTKAVLSLPLLGWTGEKKI